jgi:hypothetical protein
MTCGSIVLARNDTGGSELVLGWVIQKKIPVLPLGYNFVTATRTRAERNLERWDFTAEIGGLTYGMTRSKIDLM